MEADLGQALCKRSILFLSENNTISHYYSYRSAPTSPSHMSGVYTPDSLSREGSPTPEDEIIQQQSNQQVTMVTNVAQRQPVLPPSAAELRIGQSAAGFPATSVLAG